VLASTQKIRHNPSLNHLRVKNSLIGRLSRVQVAQQIGGDDILSRNRKGAIASFNNIGHLQLGYWNL